MPAVKAPVAGFSGTSVCGVVFTDGVADTDNEAALRYFRAAGYTVEDAKPKATRAKAAPKPKADEGDQPAEADAEAKA